MLNAPAPAPVKPPIPFLDLKALHASIAGDVERALAGVLQHGQFIMGPEVPAFEQAFASWCGAPHAVGCANGTAALHAILHCLGIGPGDEVICPAHTFIATAESILQTGARPVFAEVDPHSWLLDPAAVAAALTPRTRAVVPVHIYGMPAPMNALNELACRHGLPVVEDAAQGHGATLQGRRAGAMGLAAAFSFFPGKNLGAFGDAGGVTTLDGELARRVRLYVNHGREAKYEHLSIGTNYRLDTLQAAILQAKLPHLDGWNARRRALAARYRTLLSAEPFPSFGVALQHVPEGADSCYHLFVVTVPRRDHVIAALKQAGIATGVHYPLPLHLQPALASVAPPKGALPVTERLGETVLSLPMCPTLPPEAADTVVAALRGALEKA